MANTYQIEVGQDLISMFKEISKKDEDESIDKKY